MPTIQKAYLGATPLFRQQDWFESNRFTSLASNQVTLTANSTPHTKGAWSEIIASTADNASLLCLEIGGVAQIATNTATLLDIATGSSGSESVIFSNIAIGSVIGVIEIPFKVPSGTRLSARIQSVVSSKTCIVRIVPIQAGDYDTAPTSVDVIGGDTTTSQGISFSGSITTWVEGVASTSRAYRAIGLLMSAHDAVIANFTNEYPLGIGAAGSETVIGNIRQNYNANEQAVQLAPRNSYFGYPITAGSRLSVRHTISANPERYGFCLIGIP